jgi:hypothetical protein
VSGEGEGEGEGVSGEGEGVSGECEGVSGEGYRGGTIAMVALGPHHLLCQN